jgi:ecotin
MINKTATLLKVSAISLSLMACAQSATPTSEATINVGENPASIQQDDIKMYNKAEGGQTRHVIALSPLTNESDARIEIRLSKEIMADCNVRGWSGKLTTETVKGWGYSYQVFQPYEAVPTTLMACPEPAELKKVYSQPLELQRYNSKRPIVFYTDSNVDVDVRVWTPNK